MSYTILLLEKARLELTESAKWYDEQSDGLGDRFINEVQGKINLIANNPNLYQKHKSGNQQAVVNTFPFIIVFFAIKQKNELVVLSIFHTSRNPKQKLRRKP